MQQGKEKKFTDYKGRSKIVFICKWYHIENPKESTEKLLEVISEFSKVAGYDIQKSIVFLYISN